MEELNVLRGWEILRAQRPVCQLLKSINYRKDTSAWNISSSKVSFE